MPRVVWQRFVHRSMIPPQCTQRLSRYFLSTTAGVNDASAAGCGCGSGSAGGGLAGDSGLGGPGAAHGFHVDPRRLPNTIPGIGREELAARLEKQQREFARKYEETRADDLVREIDTMRRAMPPEEFKRFLRGIEEAEAKDAREAAKTSAMSPMQLYRYQQRQRRRLQLQLFAKTVVIFVAIFGCVFFLFFFFFFFH
ncbi:unnamed protein product [Trypanosoma congolense IL3000]|uniref:WGS project CAEQ00000000 data, annotated contig 284 n=1 Tax=Trypanosoma congolense (strain IL3000) TaxID=1068625 RepID=F9WEK9_TRYCI|nr:unnamed protein product [Trypanosoma congolense IL3000]